MPRKDAANRTTTDQRNTINASQKEKVWIDENKLIDRAAFASADELGEIVKKSVLEGWARCRFIFTIMHEGVTLYPTYGIVRCGLYVSPKPMMMSIIDTLKIDDWDLALWFCSSCAMLDGRRPMDVIHFDPQAVWEAAKNETIGSRIDSDT